MRRCVFLDRDGVINRKAPEGDYIKSWAEFEPIPAAVDWIRLFNALGLLVIVVTNQRGVARGRMSADALAEIHLKMRDQLASRGAWIDDILCCTEEDDASEFRKPNPGMVLEAQRRWGIDLSQSILIGDSDSDAELARRTGMTFVRVQGGEIDEVVLKRAAARSSSR